ncbi:MAG: ribbon-helix-helix protein, CopG family [Nitrospira sp.]|nr:ribbon-helix-helix protein, CopG family [Nitrospira sp.]
MKASTISIRLHTKIQRELDRLSRQLERSRSDIVRDAVRRQVALLRFERSRRALRPFAEARGMSS